MSSNYRYMLYSTVFLLVSVLSESVMANSKLTVNEDFNVISVNGTSVEQKLFTNNNQVSLKSGINKIALIFEVVYENDDDFDIIKSDAFVISFYAKNHAQYLLKYLKSANSRAARKYALNPIFSIEDIDGRLIQNKSRLLESNSESFVNQQTKPSLMGQTRLLITSDKTPQGNKNKSPEDLRAINSNQDVDPVEMLDYWWLQASPKQRKSFLDKIETLEKE